MNPQAPHSSARRSSLWLLLAIALGSMLPLHVRADSAEVKSQVIIILGSTESTEVAPELSKIDALKQAPFDAFTKKALLKRVEVSLVVGQSQEVELPNGRKLRLSLLEKTTDGRYRVSVSINRPGKQDYLPVMTVAAAPGDPFFIAGQKYEGGTLIIGVSLGKPG